MKIILIFIALGLVCLASAGHDRHDVDQKLAERDLLKYVDGAFRNKKNRFFRPVNLDERNDLKYIDGDFEVLNQRDIDPPAKYHHRRHHRPHHQKKVVVVERREREDLFDIGIRDRKNNIIPFGLRVTLCRRIPNLHRNCKNVLNRRHHHSEGKVVDGNVVEGRVVEVTTPSLQSSPENPVPESSTETSKVPPASNGNYRFRSPVIVEDETKEILETRETRETSTKPYRKTANSQYRARSAARSEGVKVVLVPESSTETSKVPPASNGNYRFRSPVIVEDETKEILETRETRETSTKPYRKTANSAYRVRSAARSQGSQETTSVETPQSYGRW